MKISKAYINRTAYVDADSSSKLLIMSALLVSAGPSEDRRKDEGIR